MLEVKNLEVKYKFGATALSNISFTLQDKGLCCILGDTESGKTTLLKTIAGLLMPEKGELLLDKTDMFNFTVKDRNVCLVHEDYGFFENKNLLYNLNYPQIIRGKTKEQATETSVSLAKKHNIEQFLTCKVKSLEKPVKCLASIIRTCMRKANIYLFDDPFRGIDNREMIFDYCFPLIKSLAEKAYVLFATANSKEAKKINVPTLILNYGIQHQFGFPKDIIENPVSYYAYSFLEDEFNSYIGTLSEKNNELILSYNNKEVVIDRKRLLNAIFIDKKVIVCEKIITEKKEIKIFDYKSENTIYF